MKKASRLYNLLLSAGIVVIFLLFMNIMAYLQIVMVFKTPFTLSALIIPNLIALIFASILLATRHYYQLSKKRLYYEKLAKTDPLTGTLNRYACEIIYELEQKKFSRTQHPFSLLLLDIDDFKSINDSFGHSIGDKVLKELTQLITQILREMDILCRWGGEEFVIILPHTDEAGAQMLTKKLLDTIASHTFPIEYHRLTVSIGIFTVTSKDESLLSAIEKADFALYQAKHAGKNCFKVAH